MYAAVVVLKPGADQAKASVDSASLTDAFWAHAQEGDGMEHVRIADGADGFSVVLFMHGGDEAEVATSALALCWRLVMVMPPLTGWYVDSCVVRGAWR
ncbi:hypothetical protein [Streptomyces spinosus]|uniref:hypothetical protein n=1 Tax=Streptomyces spinosus TaxID=2872623 RepID=UPI001CEDB4D1|nr:hypothetical protein [Streptomyces spinosus]